MITILRKEAKIDLERDFFKVMSNFAFEKQWKKWESIEILN